MEEEKMNYKNIFGWFFVITGILFLVMILAWTLATLQGFSTLSHEQEMERLELKKEIALIEYNTVIINDDLTDFENVTITQTVKEELKEIDCLANTYQWNTETQEYDESELFEQPPKCYEIIGDTIK